MKTYSEQDEIIRYVWTHYSKFCTETEMLADRAIHAELKAQNTDSTAMSEMLRKKWGHRNNPDVLRCLACGNDAFRQRTCERIISEHADQLFINMCPKCNCVVETPTACLCKWCGNTWFDRREELRQVVEQRIMQKDANHALDCTVNPAGFTSSQS